MKSKKRWLALAAVLFWWPAVGSDFALAKPKMTHEKVKGHKYLPNGGQEWVEYANWKESSATTADSAALVTTIEHTFPADAANVMFSYTRMDDAMNILSARDIADLASQETRITRSVGGLPSVMDILVDDRILGTDGFEIRRSAGFPVTFSHFEPDVNGLFIAWYIGQVPAGETWEIFDPTVDTAFSDFTNDQAHAFELGILTPVPEPESVVLLLIGVAAVVGCGYARRSRAAPRRRLALALPSKCMVFLAVLACATAAHAKPSPTIHWTDWDHFGLSWWRISHWKTRPTDTLSPLRAGIPQRWTYEQPSHFSMVMWDASFMDMNMDELAYRDQDDLTFMDTTFVLSNDAEDSAPPSMVLSILEDVQQTADGFEHRRVAPLHLPIVLKGISPSADPAYLYALYEGTVPEGEAWLITEPVLGATPVVALTDKPYVLEFGIYIPVPEPGSIVLLVLGSVAVAAIGYRRRRTG